MDEASKPVRPHDPETIALGRQQIALIREQLRTTRPRPTRQAPASPPVDRPESRPVEDVDAFGDRLAAEMASGAERDLLAARVAQLEVEVGELRAALAEILRTAAGAVSNQSTTATNTAATDRTESSDSPIPQ